jgi:hypothetical protein
MKTIETEPEVSGFLVFNNRTKGLAWVLLEDKLDTKNTIVRYLSERNTGRINCAGAMSSLFGIADDSDIILNRQLGHILKSNFKKMSENKIISAERLPASNNFKVEFSTKDFGHFSVIMQVESNIVMSSDLETVYPFDREFGGTRWYAIIDYKDWYFRGKYIVEDGGNGEIYVVNKGCELRLENAYKLLHQINAAIMPFFQEKLNENIKYF